MQMSNTPNQNPLNPKPAPERADERKTPQHQGESGSGAKQQGGSTDSDAVKPTGESKR
jgi:hypothetical protein